MLQVRNDVHHSGRAVRVGAVVGGVAIKQLHEVWLAQLTPVPAVQRAKPGEAMGKAGGGAPFAGFAAAPLVEALFEEDASGGFEGGRAVREVRSHPGCRHVKFSSARLAKRPAIGPRRQPLTVLPEVMGRSVQSLVREGWGEVGSGRRFLTGEGVQFKDQFRPGEERRSDIESVPTVGLLAQLATGFFRRFKDGYPVPLRSRANGSSHARYTGANDDGAIGPFGHQACWSLASLSLTSWKQMRNQTVKLAGYCFNSYSKSSKLT